MKHFIYSYNPNFQRCNNVYSLFKQNFIKSTNHRPTDAWPPTIYSPTYRPNNYQSNRQDSTSKTW